MAYATVAGLPVAVGLYTAFIPMGVYALLGSSRVLSVSSTTTLAILAGTQLGLAVPDGDPAKLVTATATLTALVGALLILARLMRLGFVANFISAPVLTGFKAGIGLVIVSIRSPKPQIHITKQGFADPCRTTFRNLADDARGGRRDFLVLIGMSACGRIISRRWWRSAAAPRKRGSSARRRGVSIVGLIPQGFPFTTMPDLALIEQLARRPGDALMSFTKRSRRVAPLHPGISHRSRVIATGALRRCNSNAMRVAAALADRGRARRQAGAKASLVTAGSGRDDAVVGTLAGLLPNATLAAIVIVTGRLIQPAEFVPFAKCAGWVSLGDRRHLGVLLLGTLKGIVWRSSCR
jgi:hypothetical protein